MNLFSLFADAVSMTAPSAPLSPALDSLPWLRHAAWSLVLAATALLLGPKRPGLSGRSGVVAVLLAAWAWVPGPWGLAYWLGLAFQIPSLLSCLLAVSVVQRAVVGGTHAGGERGRWAAPYVGAGVLLGWILLLDTFALLPASVYAWGFGPGAFVVVCALALLPWVAAGPGVLRASGAWQVGLALVVFGLWRWPSGNVWDAVLDPCLWLVLNGMALRAASRRWRSRD
jgi:hypothetical protein